LARRSEKTWKELTELVAAFEVYVANLNVCDHQHLRTAAPLLEEGLGPHRRAVAGGIDGPPWPKGLLIGLRQGARETFPQMAGTFRTHPEVVKEIRRAGGESLTQLLDYPAQTAKMIKRGRIRNVDEYYAVRARIDEIEGCSNNDAELRGLYELLGRFELRARQAPK
jgi:hypothetical protein